MAEWSDSKLYLEGNGLFLLLVPALGYLAYWVYRHTYPEVDTARRSVLVVLRGAALVLLVSVLAEPVFAWWSKQVIKPLVLVLVDTSASMNTTERGTTRLQQIAAVIADAGWRSRLAQAEIRAWGFAESVYPLALDTAAVVQAGGQATNIGHALVASLESIDEREQVQGFILLSDGGHNLGRDPVQLAEELGAPVYALGVGGEELPAGIQLAGVSTVQTGYVGQRQRIDADVRSWGYEGVQAEVRLYEGERELQRQAVVLGGQGQLQRVSFTLTPQQAGPRIFRVVVTPEEGEFTRADNEALVFTRILEERTRVLLLAGGPGADLTFLYRSLVADSNIVVETAVQRADDALYGGGWSPAILRDRDVVFLVNPGAWLLNGPPARELAERVEAGTGLVLVGGVRTARDWRADSPLAKLVPLQPSAPFTEGETLLRIGAEGRYHPVIRKQADDPWGRLPPLPGYFRVVRPWPGSLVLIEESRGAPIFVAGTYGQGKILVALSASFWRLDLMSSGVDGQPQTIRQLWRDAAKWLALDAPSGRIRASTERHVYRGGEEVVFAAQVFDELLRPQQGAAVQIAMPGRIALELQDQGAGHYRGVYSGLEPGEYTYSATAGVDGAEVGVDEGRFIVEEYSIEFSDLRADQALLGDLAHASGGAALPLSDWEDLLHKLAPRKKVVEEAQSLSLWGPLWPAWLAIVLLAAEWLVRKRSGMI